MLRNQGGEFSTVFRYPAVPDNSYRGGAAGDFDNDGRIDVAVLPIAGQPLLLQNKTANSNTWVGLHLRGTRSNRDAIGASVQIASCGKTQFDTVRNGGSYLSRNDPRLHFGLGSCYETGSRNHQMAQRSRASAERPSGGSLHDGRGAPMKAWWSGPLCVACLVFIGFGEAWQAGNFVDITAASGVRFKHVASHTSKKYLPETMGSGVALFDYDNDGRLDIFLVNGAPLDDPTPKGTIPAEDRAEVLESPVSPEKRRNLRRRHREGRSGGSWLWHGRCGRRLRQRRL